jgi:DNA-directed RNA polymerase I, II, and III subunit RPABC3
MSSEPELFTSPFTVVDVNSAKYDRVSRIYASSVPSSSVTAADVTLPKDKSLGAAPLAPGEIYMTLDINTELYPLSIGDRFQCTIASTLTLGGPGDMDEDGPSAGQGNGAGTSGVKNSGLGWRDVGLGEPTLADHYEYVCHGKVYRFEEAAGERLSCYASFGGLLMKLDGPYQKVTPLRIDYVYLLMRKT